MCYDRKESHCPWATLRDAACAVPEATISCGIVVCVSDVAGVAVVCHNDVNRDASFDGDWVDLLAEDPVEALGEVSDSSCKRMLVVDCVFQSGSECVVCPSAAPCPGPAVMRPSIAHGLNIGSGWEHRYLAQSL